MIYLLIYAVTFFCLFILAMYFIFNKDGGYLIADFMTKHFYNFSISNCFQANKYKKTVDVLYNYCYEEIIQKFYDVISELLENKEEIIEYIKKNSSCEYTIRVNANFFSIIVDKEEYSKIYSTRDYSKIVEVSSIMDIDIELSITKDNKLDFKIFSVNNDLFSDTYKIDKELFQIPVSCIYVSTSAKMEKRVTGRISEFGSVHPEYYCLTITNNNELNDIIHKEK